MSGKTNADTAPKAGAAADAVIARLPAGPFVTPLDIAMALGLRGSRAVIRKIESGELDAVNYGRPGRGLYFVLRTEAEKHIRARTAGTGAF
jgi:hypothetical protein